MVFESPRAKNPRGRMRQHRAGSGPEDLVDSRRPARITAGPLPWPVCLAGLLAMALWTLEDPARAAVGRGRAVRGSEIVQVEGEGQISQFDSNVVHKALAAPVSQSKPIV